MHKKRTYFVDHAFGREQVSDSLDNGPSWDWCWESILSLPARHAVVWCADLYRQLAVHGMLHQASWPEGMRLDSTDEGSPRLAFGESPIYVRWVMGERSFTLADAINLVPGARPESGWKADMYAILRATGCGHDAYTASGLGSRVLRNTCDYEMIQKWKECAAPLQSQHPRAGRCEIYRLPFTSPYAYTYWDMSLAYLTAAASPLPTRFIEDTHLPPSMLDSSMMADVIIETEHPVYPKRIKPSDRTGRLITIYPVGKFRTVLCGEELAFAANAGHVKEVNRVHKWEMGTFLLPYVQRMHSAIEQTTGRQRKAIKLIALAGLGATSRREVRWLPIKGFDPEPGFIGDYYQVSEDGEIRRCRRVYGETYAETPGTWAGDSRPQLWSWIVSRVRLQLSNALRALGKNVYYCDTDGLIADAYGSALMKSWSERWPEHRWRNTGRTGPLTLHSWRRYSIGDEGISGLPEHATQVGVHSWTWDSIEKWDESMQAQRMPDGRAVKRRTRLLPTYEHGHVQEDGHIVPFRLNDDCGIV